MKQENEPNDELQHLLEALDQHGKNLRRQQQLSDLIDHLAEKEKTVVMPQKRRKLIPLWWAMGAAAACLLLWLVVKPTDSQTQNEGESLLAEEVVAKDSVATEIETIAPVQKPIPLPEPIAEKQLSKTAKPKAKATKKVETDHTRAEEIPILVEVAQTETTDTEKTESIAPINETPNELLALENQTPRRRVIKSESLVGYGKLEKQPDQSRTKRPVFEDKTIFGQPQDPNMKNGMLAMEIKF